jgi:sRNA-binding protein
MIAKVAFLASSVDTLYEMGKIIRSKNAAVAQKMAADRLAEEKQREEAKKAVKEKEAKEKEEKEAADTKKDTGKEKKDEKGSDRGTTDDTLELKKGLSVMLSEYGVDPSKVGNKVEAAVRQINDMINVPATRNMGSAIISEVSSLYQRALHTNFKNDKQWVHDVEDLFKRSNKNAKKPGLGQPLPAPKK